MDLGGQLSGKRQLMADLRNLSPGTYIVEVRGEGITLSERFVR
ncbi:MAG: T9SS type A sorting domain-containing protein [Flavobacteriales bacterium]|nr:T9SS type A sorting domain-containing protein [Flavobacteriales bacterium]